MKRLEVLGWWFRPLAPTTLPRPQALVAEQDPAAVATIARYLRAGTTLVTYPEPSFCRFECGEADMGARDLTDGTFVWPDGLVHYVERHGVRLPGHFVAHVMAQNGIVAPFRVPKAAFGLYDAAPWSRWSREQGACPDLDGFDLPDDDLRERIADELGDVEGDVILACRGATREVVIDLGAGAIELRQARAGGAPARRFAGWHEWPIAGAAPAAAVAPAPSLVRPERPRPGVPMNDFLRSLRAKLDGDDDPDGRR